MHEQMTSVLLYLISAQIATVLC